VTWPDKIKHEQYHKIAQRTLAEFKIGDLVKQIPEHGALQTEIYREGYGIVIGHAGTGHLWEAMLEVLIRGKVRLISARALKNLSR
jgi:hypothetical protein